MRPLLAALAVAAAALAAGCGEDSRARRTERPDPDHLFDLEIGVFSQEDDAAPARRVPIQARLAITRSQRSEGLKHINYLPRNEGMLFLFSESHGPDKPGSLTMEDCKIPLTVAFLEESGRIVQLTRMNLRPAPDDYVCRIRHRFWLEMNQGFYEENDISVGDKVLLSETMLAIADEWAD